MSVYDNSPNYVDIARKLLNDKLLLTALELHTELLESGKELALLKDFFSNPGNFESHAQENVARICEDFLTKTRSSRFIFHSLSAIRKPGHFGQLRFDQVFGRRRTEHRREVGRVGISVEESQGNHKCSQE